RLRSRRRMVARIRQHAAHVRLRLRAVHRARGQSALARRRPLPRRLVPATGGDEGEARCRLVGLMRLPIAVLCAAAAWAQSVPPTISTDPPSDKAHPAKMTVLHIPSHGVLINGLVYHPQGAGPHPTLVLCHGLPGNEKNLDLAQSVRRAGWNAVTF